MLFVQFDKLNMTHRTETYNASLYTHEGVQQKFIDAADKAERLAILKAEMETVPKIDSIEKALANSRAIMIGSDNPPTDEQELVHRAESYHVITEQDADYIIYHDPKFTAAE